MNTVILDRPGAFERIDRPDPDEPGEDDAIVAPRRVGLCGTDYHAYAGHQNLFTYPRVLGHEIAVEVIALGAKVGHVAVGDHCAVLPYVACLACSACIRGKTNCCERLGVLGVTMDGGLCEQLTVPASSLFVGHGLSDDALALVETLGIGLHAVERSNVEPGEHTLVVGAGPIGLAIAQAALVRGAEVAITDTNEIRVRSAQSLLGLPTFVNGEGLEDDLRDLGDGELPTTVFEATGNAASMEAAARFVNSTGSLVLVGHSAGRIGFDNSLIHRRELTIRTSRNALATEWPYLLDLVSSGRLDALAWINRRMPLDDVPEGFAEWSHLDSGVLKGIVDVGDTRPRSPARDQVHDGGEGQ